MSHENLDDAGRPQRAAADPVTDQPPTATRIPPETGVRAARYRTHGILQATRRVGGEPRGASRLTSQRRPHASVATRREGSAAGTPIETIEIVITIVRGTVMRILPGDPEAEDVIQESLIRIVVAPPSLRDRERLPAYARAVARNTAFSHLARKRRRRRLAEALELLKDTATSPRAFEPHLRRAYAALAQEQRHVIFRRFVEGATLREIAAEKGVPLQTVFSRLRHALQRLRAELRDPTEPRRRRRQR